MSALPQNLSHATALLFVHAGRAAQGSRHIPARWGVLGGQRGSRAALLNASRRLGRLTLLLKRLVEHPLNIRLGH